MWPIRNSKAFKNVSWPIKICIKYFMSPAKTLRSPPSPTYLMYGPLQERKNSNLLIWQKLYSRHRQMHYVLSYMNKANLINCNWLSKIQMTLFSFLFLERRNASTISKPLPKMQFWCVLKKWSQNTESSMWKRVFYKIEWLNLATSPQINFFTNNF